MTQLDQLSINTIRILSAEAIQKANSGHPGLPLGVAPMAYELWANHMKHHSKNPNWHDRDRFILSAGHGSMLLYSLLHLFGYGLTIEDLKQFRQWGSKTPGHPEYGHTVGIETTTGPLGAGFATAVGMAMAEANLAAKFNKPEYPVVNHYTYTIAGDGCMMEGITSEAASLAATLKLGKLIAFYDSNNISIEGHTDIAFTEDVGKRYEAYGWQVLYVNDGNDTQEISDAIVQAKNEQDQPSLIIVKTIIGYGCPNKQGTASAHGEPLGEDNLKETKKFLGWPLDESFYVPEQVYSHMETLIEKGNKEEQAWNQLMNQYRQAYPELAKEWEQWHSNSLGEDLIHDESFWTFDKKAIATRALSGQIINTLTKNVPNLIGGSADLAPSTKTYMSDRGDFSAENYEGMNLHFGVRELAMAAIGNGLCLHGGLKAFVSTFFVFSDYVKPSIRLSALMQIPLIFVLTHDSIGVGEDGPTHQPIEQLASLRSTPNVVAFRPADAKETAAAWYFAITSKQTPTALVLTRQNVPYIEETSKEALKGGYTLISSDSDTPELILMASGSEVQYVYEAGKQLMNDGVDVSVVSMPSMDIFEKQSEAYKEKVLPNKARKRLAVEAATSFGWYKYVGLDGDVITIDHFGASGPGHIVYEQYGLTTENVLNKAKALLGK